MRAVNGHIRSNMVAYVAILVALVTGGGAAYAATLVTSKNIKNDTVRVIDLDFPIGAKVSELKSPVPLLGEFETVLSTTVTPNDGGALGVVQAVAVLQNTSNEALEARLRLSHKGSPQETRVSLSTCPPGQRPRFRP